MLAPNFERGEHVVGAEEAGARCDVLVARLAGASRSAVASAIKAGAVRVNGTAVKASTPLEPGDVVVYAVATALPALEALPEALPLEIVYEDEEILVVDKPAGMTTHPARGAVGGTLVNALLAHVQGLPGEPLRAGLVHRLDRDTSGLLVVAKTSRALTTLGKALQRRYVKREYRGLVVGIPREPAGTIEGAIGRDPHDRRRFAIRADGKPAITHYALREALRHAAELTFRLETGRTHQIRVHLSALGNPIVNDPLYGRRDGRVPLPGQALHAWKLAFRHPATGNELAFEAPPPPGYLATLEQLRG